MSSPIHTFSFLRFFTSSKNSGVMSSLLALIVGVLLMSSRFGGYRF
ncbi:hypothetical protein BN341_9110 [Helicobacter heilmannii ASB1.4]|uniref:Uncharacterized protein n=1 Tax=Helicobacter heilmannii TaxID=35817 RepID=A0A0K2YBI6_HELHE|nr:hypothetical protein BN341_9110 [Helicobacter heilmannii ASB1.4]CRI35064.1 hypothetical protein HHE01_00620 [Helicobacter heilmannii]